MSDWKKMQDTLAGVANQEPALGAVHHGLTNGIAIGEGWEPLSRMTRPEERRAHGWSRECSAMRRT
jgi:hypothetical protein